MLLLFSKYFEKSVKAFLYTFFFSNLFISSRQEILNYLYSLSFSYIIHFY